MFKLDAYQLKWIAIIGMFLSHVVAAWWPILPEFLRIPFWMTGGFTFPIMAYFVVEGYRHTSNLKKYLGRLLLMGLMALPFHIMSLTFPLGGGIWPVGYPYLNIMFSICVSLLVLVMYDRLSSRFLFWVIFLLGIVPFSFLFLEWYFIGITMVLLHHIIKNETARRIIPSLFAAGSYLLIGLYLNVMASQIQGALDAGYDWSYFTGWFPEGAILGKPEFAPVMLSFPLGILAAGFLLKNFNGERGKNSKWLFYIFYPAHFVLLAAGIWFI